MSFLLLHGGFHGGWCWREVARPLRQAGHEVATPTLTGLGERAHLLRDDLGVSTAIADVCAVIEAEELAEIVLVGHSLGGVTIAGVADRMGARLSRLVYLDALIVRDQECVLDGMPPEIAAKRRQDAADTGRNVMAPYPGAAFDLTDPDQIAWVERRLTPQPFGFYTERLRLSHPLGNGVPCTYIACTRPLYAATAASRAWAARQPGWDMREIAASHDAMVDAPEALAALLLDIAGARPKP